MESLKNFFRFLYILPNLSFIFQTGRDLAKQNIRISSFLLDNL